MQVEAIRTHKITPNERILSIIDTYIHNIQEESVLIITSKILALCQGLVVKVGEVDKMDLVKKYSQYYLEPDNTYHVALTITNNTLIATAGIDESNTGGYYVLWPSNPFKAAQEITDYIRQKYSLTKLAVIITDSKTTPLRWGTSGIALAYAGLEPLKSYIGSPDIFGRNLKMTNSNIVDGLACAAVVCMGEGDEQTPLAMITKATMVDFISGAFTKKEINDMNISLEDDIYAPLLQLPAWKKGENEGVI
jgi:dihydrofolate synthase / folylpolyglutamate synthase